MNTRGFAVALVTLIVGLIIWASTIDVVVDEISNVNTTGWDFTGYSGAESLIDLTPFAYIAGGFLMVVGVALGLAGRGD